MNAFDVKVSTFGGANHKPINIHRFYEEKNAFVKPYNERDFDQLYKKTYVKFPGPIFTTQYDNKYPEQTVFANDGGWKHESMKINQQAKEMLTQPVRAEQFDDIKVSCIQIVDPGNINSVGAKT